MPVLCKHGIPKDETNTKFIPIDRDEFPDQLTNMKCFFLILFAALSVNLNVSANDRIGVRQSKFINLSNGEEFVPRGFNYVRLRPQVSNQVVHANYDPVYYIISEIDDMFQDLKTNNFNVVRVFLDVTSPLGLFETDSATRFSPQYMTNVIDFLQRADTNEIYVIFAFDMWGPPAKSWLHHGPLSQAKVTGVNWLYFREGAAETRAALLSAFAEDIKSNAPELLPVILSYEIQNELCYFMDYEPLSLTTGFFDYNDKSYDLSSETGLQKLMDAQAENLCNQCVTEVGKIDSEAMVSVSVFTFNAVGRTGPVYLKSDTTPDQRVPARPLALTKSKLDFVDIHIYPSTANSIAEDYRSIDFETTRKDCARIGVPLLMGEFGAFSHRYPTLSLAVNEMSLFATQTFNKGFTGWLFWTYDTTEQEGLWTAKDGDSAIFKSLAYIFPQNILTSGTIYLSDDFNISSGGGNINFDNSGGRQTGILAPTDYLFSCDIFVNNSGTYAAKCRMLSQDQPSLFSLNQTLTNSHDFEIELEFSHQTLNSNTWFGICFGKDLPMWEPWKPSGMSVIFRDNGVYTFFDDNDEIGNANYPMAYPVKVRICVSQFDYGDNALVSMFLNDVPMIIDTSINSYVYSHKNGFTNNFITCMSYTAGDVLLDNLKISVLKDSGPIISPWTSDADSGITNTKIYTHAVNFTTPYDVNINGVNFTGVGNDLSGENWMLYSPSNDFVNLYINDAGLPDFLSGNSFYLTTGAVYSTDYSSALMLSNLNINFVYELTLYCLGYDEINHALISGSTGGKTRDFSMARYGIGNAQKITYEYIPNENGTFSITSTSVPGDSTNIWAWYAFSNKAITVIPEPVCLIYIFGILFLVKQR